VTYAERRQAERRDHALAAWRALGRRAGDKRRVDNARVAHWLARFEYARNCK
jgi:hypothetical protein